MSLLKARSFRSGLLSLTIFLFCFLLYTASVLHSGQLEMRDFTHLLSSIKGPPPPQHLCIAAEPYASSETKHSSLIFEEPKGSSIHKTWEFTAARDARVYGLTTEQCDSAFPGLFAEIKRAVTYQKNTRQITPDDIDISWKENGAVRALIIDQQVCSLMLFCPECGS